MLPELGYVPIAAVTPAQLEALIGALATDGMRRAGGLHPKTVKHAWHVTRQVFSYALRHDAITSNSFDRVDFTANRSTGDRDEFEPHPLTAEQIADVCAALRGERPGRDGKPLPALPVYALMVEFAAYTGLRASELAGLEIADLVFAPVAVGAQHKCLVRIERTKVKSKRAGEGWIVGTPKSRHSRRSVPLPGWLAAKTADYLAHDHLRATEPDAPLWPGRADQAARAGRTADDWRTALDWSQPVESGTFYRYAFAHALAAVGLPVTTPTRAARTRSDGTIEPARPACQGVRLHDLRHSAAVAWLQAGVPVVQVSRWLGHAHGAPASLELQTFAVCNSRLIGGGRLIAPHARPDDGLLDVCLIEAMPTVEFIALLRQVAKGEHLDDPRVTYFQSASPELSFDRTIKINTDGEVIETDRSRYEIEPRAVRILGGKG